MYSYIFRRKGDEEYMKENYQQVDIIWFRFIFHDLKLKQMYGNQCEESTSSPVYILGVKRLSS